MEYTTFTLRLPKEMVEDLDATAFQKYKKRNCRNQLITEILADGLHAHAPPSIPTQTRSAQAKANTARARRNTDVN